MDDQGFSPTLLFAALEALAPSLALCLYDGQGELIAATTAGRACAAGDRPRREMALGACTLLRYDDDEASPPDPQLLRFAEDIAQSRATEREATRSLRDTVLKLESALSELAAAHAELARQRDEDWAPTPTHDVDAGASRTARRPRAPEELHGMVSGDATMLRVFDTIRLVAMSDATVLVQGESGTGKELIARALHLESDRRDAPFVAINCAAIAASIAESELFGHKRGSFTGAIADAPGVFARAHRGTLFLDEVAELPLDLQSKLLRAVQERIILPVGAREPIAVDVRLVAASHKSLSAEVAAGRFREDLMYRLRVVPIDLPPLRDRKGDVDILLRTLVRRLAERTGRRVAALAPAAVRALQGHPFPGNVRELENALEHAFAVGRGERIDLEHLPDYIVLNRSRPDAPPPLAPTGEAALLSVRSLNAHVGDEEASAIRAALDRTQGRVAEAAELLGVSRATFHRKRRKHGID